MTLKATGMRGVETSSHTISQSSQSILMEVGRLLRLTDLVRAEDPGLESRLHRDFSGLTHTIDLKIGTPVSTLPGAWSFNFFPTPH